MSYSGSGSGPHSAPPSSVRAFDRAKVDAIVDPIVHAHGGEVVDIEFKSEPSGWVLRIYVEKLGSAEHNASTEQAAVDLDLCSHVAREVSPALDVADLIPHRYHLEVSSPGVERPLRQRRDFVRFAGKKAKLKLHAAVRGQKVLVGILGPCGGDSVEVIDGHNTYAVAFDNVAAARLVFEFGPAPKPGKKTKK
jgi:ribosome maturation factor RimP